MIVTASTTSSLCDSGKRGKNYDNIYPKYLVFSLTGPWSVHFTDYMRHSGLVAHVGGEMARLGGVILGESLHLTTMSLAALAGQEAQRAMTRG